MTTGVKNTCGWGEMEFVFTWMLFGIGGAAILSRYNKAGIGCLLGTFLGPIGLLIALVMRSSASSDELRLQHHEQMAALAAVRQPTASASASRNERACPFCAERILVEARVCKHCGRDVVPLA
jgi:hypothetical protein